MNGREALKALVDGEKVRHVRWPDPNAHMFIDYHGDLLVDWPDPNARNELPQNSTAWTYETVVMHPGPFEVLRQRATDAELVAAFEHLDRVSRDAGYKDAAVAWRQAAVMLRERKLKP